MLALALIVAAATATTAAWGLLRRRRARRAGLLAAPLHPKPAGVHHLASSVSELSDLGLHLHAARRAAGRPRLGAVLEQR
jgi:hypothetical protein